MNPLTTIILILLVSLPGYSFQKEMETPSFSKEWKKPSHESYKLKNLLDQRDINGFYEASIQTLDQIYKKEEDHQSIEDIKNHLLIRYLIASTPFIDLTSKENVMWIANKGDLDFQAKSNVIHRMSLETLLNITPEEERKFNINKIEALHIYFSSLAIILKQFRDQIDPNFEEKKKKAIELGNTTPAIMNDEYESVVYFNRLSEKEGRHYESKGIVEEMEKSLMNLLLKAYPTKAVLVRKYLAMAGYSDKEIPFLLDRTTGRVPAAHYIYKGFPKRKD